MVRICAPAPGAKLGPRLSASPGPFEPPHRLADRAAGLHDLVLAAFPESCGVDQIAAHTDGERSRREKLGDVSRIDATGGNESQIGKGPPQRLDVFRSTDTAAGENLDLHRSRFR